MQVPEIICTGEVLVDLISTEYSEDFRSAATYQRLPGGSPANLAMNLGQLGCSVGLVATVGNDDTGALLRDELRERNVDIQHLSGAAEPTTLILVTKSKAVSNFEAYRGADAEITIKQFPDAYLQNCKIFHTTAFALSRDPARTSILEAAARAVAAGARLSIDVNYASKIWPDRLGAMWVINSYLSLGADSDKKSLVKCSDVDFVRLFDETLDDKEDAAERLLDLGAGVVCLTLGAEGCYVVSEAGSFSLPVRPVDVQDTTGAGDAFWSGFLAAHVAGEDWPTCARAGRAVAEKKLTTVGPLREALSLEALLVD
ncbi:ATP-dependent 6-phosphofructokinase [Neolewinella maritima]|uniref:ATP-dependent 6-phosphofructokinase n=1 Tax=Neolewinella maritima TaxID=1383882 RepID=A0ABM9B0I9_9BACT|nr:PfkB family carbohydrate kinase [Neolewinella maritima]CAH1000422.1 ATP-dependent 6-phosphofructokinase [Neolewinella maritima]